MSNLKPREWSNRAERLIIWSDSGTRPRGFLVHRDFLFSPLLAVISNAFCGPSRRKDSEAPLREVYVNLETTVLEVLAVNVVR